MERPKISIHVRPRQFKLLVTLMQQVFDKMTGNSYFTSPTPSLGVAQAALSDLKEAIGRWGRKGNRGSHRDYLKLLSKARYAHGILKRLASYCMLTVDPDLTVEMQATILSSSGFSLKKARVSQGRLQAVENLRRLLTPQLNDNACKLCWKQPLSVTSHGNVRSYLVFRSPVLDFTAASFIDSTTTTIYIDAPGKGTWFYWIIPVNYAGKGTISGVLEVHIAT